MRHEATNIQITRIQEQNGLLGFCDFVIDGHFQFKSVAIFSRPEGGIRLSWPEKKRGLKKITTAFPTTPQAALHIEKQIHDEWIKDAEKQNANQ
jgi:DNA-binding cell septation regulator SpoVG